MTFKGIDMFYYDREGIISRKKLKKEIYIFCLTEFYSLFPPRSAYR